jgi:hypothetical protein
LRLPILLLTIFKSILFKRGAFFIASLVLLLSNYSYLQTKNSFSKENLAMFFKDSVVSKEDTINRNFVMKKNPWKAVGLSAILPGLGQFYNESYWKLPIIAVVGGYFGYEILYNNSRFQDYKTLYEDSQTPLNPSGDLRYKSLREYYRDQRDQFILYYGIFYIITLADAYVDAHLYDFTVSDKVRFKITSSINSINLKINF